MPKDSEETSLDILGLKPFGDTTKILTEKSLRGIEGFLKLVCTPALEEVGLMFKDQVRSWRLRNALKMLEKAKGKFEIHEGQLQIKANPRVGISIIENASMIENEDLQELWAGLFVSSCSESEDDGNIIFVNLLKQITTLQARVIKYSCEHSTKKIDKSGLCTSDRLRVNFKQLCEITSISDLSRIDRELDHLRSLELLGGGAFESGGFILNDFHTELLAEISPSALCLNLYIKTQGSNLSIAEYWKV